MNILQVYNYDHNNLIDCGSAVIYAQIDTQTNYKIVLRLNTTVVDIEKGTMPIGSQSKSYIISEMAFNTYENILFEIISGMTDTDIIDIDDCIVADAFRINGLNVSALQLMDSIYSIRSSNERVLVTPSNGTRSNWRDWKSADFYINVPAKRYRKYHKRVYIDIREDIYIERIISNYVKIKSIPGVIAQSYIEPRHNGTSRGIVLSITNVGEFSTVTIFIINKFTDKCIGTFYIKDILYSLIYATAEERKHPGIVTDVFAEPNLNMSVLDAMVLAILLFDIMHWQYSGIKYANTDDANIYMSYGEMLHSMLVKEEKLPGDYGNKSKIIKMDIGSTDIDINRLTPTNSQLDDWQHDFGDSICGAMHIAADMIKENLESATKSSILDQNVKDQAECKTENHECNTKVIHDSPINSKSPKNTIIAGGDFYERIKRLHGLKNEIDYNAPSTKTAIIKCDTINYMIDGIIDNLSKTKKREYRILNAITVADAQRIITIKKMILTSDEVFIANMYTEELDIILQLIEFSANNNKKIMLLKPFKTNTVSPGLKAVCVHTVYAESNKYFKFGAEYDILIVPFGVFLILPIDYGYGLVKIDICTLSKNFVMREETKNTKRRTI